MNIKGVDLQFAIHKNDEAGLKQNQFLQRPIQDQVQLAQEGNQALQRERSRPGKVTEANGKRIHDEDEDKRDGERKKDGRQRRDESAAGSHGHGDKDSEKPKHPYKGRHIDLSM